MVANEHIAAGEDYSPHDERLIESLADGASMQVAADAGGVSYSTVRRRMKQAKFREEVRRRTRARFEGPARKAAADRYWIYEQYKKVAQTTDDDAVRINALKAMDQIACDGISLGIADSLAELDDDAS